MKLIVLDRDGVINEDSDAYIKSPAEYIPIPGSVRAIARLKKAGYTVAVATNQSGIARGLFDVAALDAMHAKLQGLLADHGAAVDGFFYCPHGPDDGCDCRKPAPGLLQAIARHFAVDLRGVPVVGDSIRDLQAALAVGALPVLVRSGKGAASEVRLADTLPGQSVPVFNKLSDYVDDLLGEKN